jgi:hypothetical protein
VHPQPGARYVAAAPGPDEIVRLGDGVIELEVEPLHAGERFRVVVGGAEIEVRGTAFIVAASAERLLDVSVSHGRVDIRPESGAPASLGAGQSWHARVAGVAEAPAVSAPSSAPPARLTAAPAPQRPMPGSRARPVAARPSALAITAPQEVPRPPAEAPPAPAAVAAPRAPVRSAEELAYDEAWQALRANNFGRAASGFSRVLLLAPDSALVEDAGFWRAVALARGKRSAEAVPAFRDFLETYPRSPRAGEAAAMLGWILIDARAYDEAAERFRAAVRDASPAVRSSAQAGLDALARHKH